MIMIKATIMELNPFHNGHKYFLEQIPKAENDILIVIISTTIVQRGEISILNKHEKSKLLLDNNVDIVIALPALFANQGGEYFAYHALEILSHFQIDELYFGSESNDINFIKNNNFITTRNFKNGIYNLGNEFFKSNDLLAVSYFKAINKLKMNVQLKPIQRITNNYNDNTIDSNQTIASATSIRSNLNQPDLIKNTLPEQSYNACLNINHKLLFNLFLNNLQFCLDHNFLIFLSEKNQLLIRLQRIINKYNVDNIDDLVYHAADRNNSKYKYQRVIINTILLVSAEKYNSNYSYIHLLGFTTAGQKYLKTLNNPLVTTSLKNHNCFVAQVEKRATNLFNLVTKQNKKHDYLPPVIKSC